MVCSYEFDEPAGTPPNPANWGYEIGDVTPDGKNGWGNEELQYYTDDPANAQTDGDGNLVITLSEASRSQECYYGPCEFESARLITQNKAEFAYGKIESRLQVPTGGDGLWPVVLGALVGMPAYLNSYAAPPLVAGLMEQGMSAGAAMAFMVAGAVSSIPAMAAVWSLVKRRVFAAYIGLGITGAIALGILGEVRWDWLPALLLGSLLGGYAGAHLAILKGNRWIKRVFEVVTLLVGAKLIVG